MTPSINNIVFAKLIALMNLGRDIPTIQKAFELGGNPLPVSQSKIRAWRNMNTDDRRYTPMPDLALICFIDGLQELSKQNPAK